MRKIVFDIETSNEFREVGSREPSALDISIMAIHDSLTDDFYSFTVDELPSLWPILEKADMLIGFNSDHFDIPLLNKYYPGDLNKIKSLDILKEIKNSLGRLIPLDNIAQTTLGVGKSSNGLEAIKWWRNGEVEKVREYCIQDVKVTKDIYEFALKNGYVKYTDRYTNKPEKIELDTSHWEKKRDSGITHTLPF